MAGGGGGGVGQGGGGGGGGGFGGGGDTLFGGNGLGGESGGGGGCDGMPSPRQSGQAAHLHCEQCDDREQKDAHMSVCESFAWVGSHEQSSRSVGSHIATSAQKEQLRQRHIEQCTAEYRASQNASHRS
mmetsp:Transcript_12475/g.26956  ORF Transcript_12475/g.26956 Transcript_12475/m.26956 type:complete len:129 (+) Transcript_12475:864-1250(+)